VLAKLNTICGIDSPTQDSGDLEGLERSDSGEIEEDEETEQTEPFTDADDSKSQETVERKRRRKRLAILKRKAKLKAYEFTNGTDVAGVLFLEIQKITDLPPERNGMYCSRKKLNLERETC
jgi:phosphatidylserine decarboxylase